MHPGRGDPRVRSRPAPRTRFRYLIALVALLAALAVVPVALAGPGSAPPGPLDALEQAIINRERLDAQIERLERELDLDSPEHSRLAIRTSAEHGKALLAEELARDDALDEVKRLEALAARPRASEKVREEAAQARRRFEELDRRTDLHEGRDNEPLMPEPEVDLVQGGFDEHTLEGYPRLRPSIEGDPDLAQVLSRYAERDPDLVRAILDVAEHDPEQHRALVENPRGLIEELLGEAGLSEEGARRADPALRAERAGETLPEARSRALDAADRADAARLHRIELEDGGADAQALDAARQEEQDAAEAARQAATSLGVRQAMVVGLGHRALDHARDDVMTAAAAIVEGDENVRSADAVIASEAEDARAEALRRKAEAWARIEAMARRLSEADIPPDAQAEFAALADRAAEFVEPERGLANEAADRLGLPLPFPPDQPQPDESPAPVDQPTDHPGDQPPSGESGRDPDAAAGAAADGAPTNLAGWSPGATGPGEHAGPIDAAGEGDDRFAPGKAGGTVDQPGGQVPGHDEGEEGVTPVGGVVARFSRAGGEGSAKGGVTDGCQPAGTGTPGSSPMCGPGQEGIPDGPAVGCTGVPTAGGLAAYSDCGARERTAPGGGCPNGPVGDVVATCAGGRDVVLDGGRTEGDCRLPGAAAAACGPGVVVQPEHGPRRPPVCEQVPGGSAAAMDLGCEPGRIMMMTRPADREQERGKQARAQQPEAVPTIETELAALAGPVDRFDLLPDQTGMTIPGGTIELPVPPVAVATGPGGGAVVAPFEWQQQAPGVGSPPESPPGEAPVDGFTGLTEVGSGAAVTDGYGAGGTFDPSMVMPVATDPVPAPSSAQETCPELLC